MPEYESVLQTPDLGPGHAREVQVRGAPVLVLNLGQTYYALDARCPESGTTLELQLGRHDRLVCPDDEAEFDIQSGERLGREGRPLRRYDVRIEGNAIKVGPPID